MAEDLISCFISRSCLHCVYLCLLSYPPHSPNTLRIHSIAGCPMGAPGGASGTD